MIWVARLAKNQGLLAAGPALADELNSGDTAWMLTSTAIVLMMTIPGVALFYGGMVRRKNVLSTLMMSFATCCLATVIWMVIRLLTCSRPIKPFQLSGFGRERKAKVW